MFKRLFVLAFILSTVGCGNRIIIDEGYIIPSANDFISFKTVAVGSPYSIMVEEYTDVLYIRNSYKLSPIMKADGTCLTLEEWKQRKSKEK